MAEAPRILQSPDEVLSTLDRDGRRRWVYPVLSRGRFLTRRAAVAYALVVLFAALPLIRVGGKPAVLLDVVAREFTFFGLTLYPTDTLLLMSFLLGTLLTVFLVSALFGRAWCGWACPQTVYMEFVFRPIERLIEGKESARRRRDEGRRTADWVLRKTLKWGVFTLIAVALANVFVAYFVGWDRLAEWMQRSPTEHPGFFAVMAITSTLILFDFGLFREQMCTIACPYARFQSVLQDRDSLIVSYDPVRGEPRGRRTRSQRKDEEAGIRLDLGDCVDCGACVRTCPMGIDIREGLQMECIACTQCIDACDAIMIGVGKPRGLIRYTSENQIERQPGRVVRPRVLAYAALLAGIVGVFAFSLTTRAPIDVNVVRSVGAPYAVLPDGDVSNRLRFRVQNRTGEDAVISIAPELPARARVQIVGPPLLHVPAGETARVEAWVVAPRDVFTNGRADARFRIGDEEHAAIADFLLLGPDEVNR